MPRNSSGRRAMLVCALLVAACSGSDADLDAGAVADAATEDSQPAVQVARLSERPLLTGRAYALEIHRPTACQGAAPCPALVLVPGALDGGLDTLGDVAQALAAAGPWVIGLYNPPGRGVGGDRSGGEEDFNGPDHRSVLSDVVARVGVKPYVRDDAVGLISIGWGLAAASALVDRSRGAAAHQVAFLIDVEGPLTRCDATASAAGPDDGPGMSDGRCNFCNGGCAAPDAGGLCERCEGDELGCGVRSFPRGCRYPETAPQPIRLCAAASPLIAAGALPCDDDTFWRQREPREFLREGVVDYVRLQFRFDHALPSPYGGREAYQLAINGEAGIRRRYNDMPFGMALGPSACAAGCELDLPEGNAIVSNPWTRGHPDLRPMGWVAFARGPLAAHARELFELR